MEDGLWEGGGRKRRRRERGKAGGEVCVLIDLSGHERGYFGFDEGLFVRDLSITS
jgi:hypothetical protein